MRDAAVAGGVVDDDLVGAGIGPDSHPHLGCAGEGARGSGARTEEKPPPLVVIMPP